MNKKSVALTEEEYEEAIDLLRKGFVLDGHVIKGNERIATIEVLQATLGLRLGDVLRLSLDSFVKDGDRYRLDIVEQKTGKERNFTVPMEVYSFIQNYAINNGIGKKAKLFDVGARQVQRHVGKVFTKMGLDTRCHSTHAFRKLFATQVYKNNNYDIVLVQHLLQHSSAVTTQLYIGIGNQTVEKALAETSKFLA